MIDAKTLAKEIVDRMTFGLDVNDIAAELVEKYEITPRKKQTPMASFCAMTCQEGGFHAFLGDRFSGWNNGLKFNTNTATAFVKDHCEIESRKELNADGPARDKWLALKADYEAWLRGAP